jgi:hypothetical protein
MLKRYVIPQLLLILVGCKCPQIIAPSIIISSRSVNEGSALKLEAPIKEGFKVFWQGPDTTYLGNTWIRKNATQEMSGTYYAKYVCEKRKKCFSPDDTTEVKIITCPQFDIPKITTNNSNPYIKDSLILVVQETSYGVVVWNGPDSTFVGNPWIRKNIPIEVSGRYSVKYARPEFEIKCESPIDTININIIDPIISEVQFNGMKYFVELTVRDKIATVNLKQDKYTTNAKDIKAIQISVAQVDRKSFEKEICRFVNHFDNSEAIVGCMNTAATAGCLLGMAVTGGTATPACAVVISVNNTVGLPACLLGIADVIAQSISKSSSYSTALTQIVSGISDGDFFSATKAAISFACIDGQGDPPTLSGGEAVVDKAAIEAAAVRAAAEKAAADKAAKDKAAKDKADRADKGGAVAGDRGGAQGDKGGRDGGDKGGGDKGGSKGGGDKGGGDKGGGDKGGGDKGGGDKGGGSISGGGRGPAGK